MYIVLTWSNGCFCPFKNWENDSLIVILVEFLKFFPELNPLVSIFLNILSLYVLVLVCPSRCSIIEND